MVPQVACRNVPHLRRARLHATGGVRPCASDGDLTYPGDWESIAPDGASVKRHMMLWRKRFQREWGEPARYIWKLEFQRRGAPHIHLWMAPPHTVGRSGRKFRDWLSQVWADIVAHPTPEQRASHLLAGTAVDILNGLRACDPKRLAIYFTKHSSPNQLGDKEYQHSCRPLGANRAMDQVVFGGSMVATSNRSRGDYSGRVPDGPKDHSSLVSVTSHLRRLPSLPHRGRATDGARRNSTSGLPDGQSKLPPNPPKTTPVQPRRSCRRIRARE
jgi:hypothetical protein